MCNLEPKNKFIKYKDFNIKLKNYLNWSFIKKVIDKTNIIFYMIFCYKGLLFLTLCYFNLLFTFIVLFYSDYHIH